MAALTLTYAARVALLSRGLEADVRVVLLRASYSPGDGHATWADAEQHEVTGPGYTAGGEARSLVLVDDRALALSSPVSWTGAMFSARYVAVIQPDPGETISDALLIGWYDLSPAGGELAFATGSLLLSWPQNEIIHLA